MTLPMAQPERLPAMRAADIARVRGLEAVILQHEQAPIVTHHLIHAGMYHRTVKLPVHWVGTGAEIKRATVLTLSGDVTVALGDGEGKRFTGYHVIPASAGRKQAFVVHAETHLTMSFPTQAQTVEEAEAEFTDETDMLVSRRDGNVITITGESI